MAQRALSAGQIDAIMALVDAGVTQVEISQRMKLSRSAVCRAIARHKAGARMPAPSRRDADMPVIETCLSRSGVTIARVPSLFRPMPR